ncbi:MAG: MBL fold metallo-hydrolase [Bacteroidota bacterium]
MTSTDHFEHDGVQVFRFGYSPVGRPYLFVNLYYVDGLLIDTGQRWARKQIQQKLSELDVQQIYITHHHEDHTGNIPELRAQFSCPVYAPERCCEVMKSPPSISVAQWLTWGPRPAYHHLLALDGQLQTPSHTFSIVPIPGHASDMVALYEPDRKWLFSADLYLNSYIGYYLKNERMSQQIASLKRALALDFKVLFCAHNPQFTDGREKLQRKLHFLEDFYGSVSHWYKQGYQTNEIYRIMNLKEHGLIHLLSRGELSKLNMVRSVIRDIES